MKGYPWEVDRNLNTYIRLSLYTNVCVLKREREAGGKGSAENPEVFGHVLVFAF